MKVRRKLLRTGYPDGRRVSVTITQTPERVIVRTGREFDILKKVPSNRLGIKLSNGQLVMECDYSNYSRKIYKFTEFIYETTFKLMEAVEDNGVKNEIKNSGKKLKVKSRRDKKSNS